MNERIRKLAEQANVLETEHYDNESALEKFAELIIQDCASELTKLGSSYEDGYGNDADYMQGMLDSADIIKERFGVEE